MFTEAFNKSSSQAICARYRILLCVCPQTTVQCPYATTYMSSYYYMCPHATTYMSSYYYMFPHTTMCVLILLYMTEQRLRKLWRMLNRD